MSKLIVVFGGSGFLGKYVVKSLCKAGYRVRVATRRPQLAGETRVAGDVGQVQLIQANVRDYDSVLRAVKGADAIINLVAILAEKGSQKFDKVILNGAKNIALAAKAEKISKLIHVSAIGADPDSRSFYAKNKGLAENEITNIVPTTVVVRPSVIFGVEDDFINKFAAMMRITPIMPLIGGGKTKFQPVFVGDVARAITACLNGDFAGKTFELGGPKTYDFEQILRFISKESQRPRWFANVPIGLMKFFGRVLDFVFKLLPFINAPFTADQMELLKFDNVANSKIGGFKELGIEDISSLEAIAPQYLVRFKPHGQFEPKPKSA